jgi:hypothetical protein
MKKSLCSLIVLVFIFSLNSCEEIFSKGLDNEAMKKLRTENTSLKIQIDKLQRQIKKDKEDVVAKDLIISMYDLRHAVEKYSENNQGDYPDAENVTELIKVVKEYLPKNYVIEASYLETIKSSAKGYIFIANINDQKIVVSNLIS